MLFAILLVLGCFRVGSLAERHSLGRKSLNTDGEGRALKPTHSGYLPVNSEGGSEMFFIFYEAEDPVSGPDTTPIVLWLQGGPGCSSMFGMLYINGPYFIHPNNLTLYRNPGSWTRRFGMLFVDQPIGTGYSVVAGGNIPNDEVTMAAHLYSTLQNFYKMHKVYRNRPLFVTGESYAGKYVPSISHYIVQAEAMNSGYADKMKKLRDIGAEVERPVFKLGGMAIGNGFTDAETQTRYQAVVAWSMGLIDWYQKQQAEAIQNEVLELLLTKKYLEARKKSDELLAYIANCSASATLEDIRRSQAYDAQDRVGLFMNLPEVKQEVGARQDITFESCSRAVDQAMGYDVMKSVKNLVPDLLKFSHVMLYQGQFDAECGYAGNDAWLATLQWPGHEGFATTPRRIWTLRDEVLGYWKQFSTLTHVEIRNAGHMVPHDQPAVAQWMIESWIFSVLTESKYDPNNFNPSEPWKVQELDSPQAQRKAQ